MNKMTSYGQVQKLDLVDTRTKVKPEESKEEARCNIVPGRVMEPHQD